MAGIIPLATAAHWPGRVRIEQWLITPMSHQRTVVELLIEGRTRMQIAVYRLQQNGQPHLFDSIEDVRQITDAWLARYNEIRPHDALGSLPPARYRAQLLAAETPL